MPVISTDFENLVSPNNKICSRNINILSVRMKFCQSNPSVWHFSTSLQATSQFDSATGRIDLKKPNQWSLCTAPSTSGQNSRSLWGWSNFKSYSYINPYNCLFSRNSFSHKHYLNKGFGDISYYFGLFWRKVYFMNCLGLFISCYQCCMSCFCCSLIVMLQTCISWHDGNQLVLCT